MIRNKPFFVISFVKDRPVYHIFNRGKIKPVERINVRKGIPLLVLVPEKYFFYHIPEDIPCLSKKKTVQAAHIYLDSLFPSKDYEVLYNGEKLIACYKNPSLSEFVKKHESIFKNANIVSSLYILSHYFGNHDWQDKSGQNNDFENCNIEDIIPKIYLPKLSNLKNACLSVRPCATKNNHFKKIYKISFLALITLMFLLAGHLFEYKNINKDYITWLNSIEKLYAMALGSNYNGNDPYGMILYQEQEIKNKKNNNTDVLQIFKYIYKSKNNKLSIDKISVKSNIIKVTGLLDNYKSIENLVSYLNKKNEYAFNIANTQDKGKKIKFTMRSKTN